MAVELFAGVPVGDYDRAEVRPEHAGHAMHTVIVDDLDVPVRKIAGRGIEPAEEGTCASGVPKVTYRDRTATRSASAGCRPRRGEAG